MSTVTVVLAVVTAVLVALLAVLATMAFQYLTQDTPLRELRVLGRGAAAGDDFFLELLEAEAQLDLTGDNRVEVLFDGHETYPRLWQDLRAAERLVCCQIFWFRPGLLADELAGILVDRAQAGATVLVLRDAYGSRPVPEAYWQRLRRAGVEVAVFRPVRWSNAFKLQRRSHVRAVVVDGRIGYTGGLAIADEWRGGGRRPGEWRDTNVRFEGPAVRNLQAAFTAAWGEATGELLLGDEPYPRDLGSAGPDRAGLLRSSPSVGSTSAERFVVLVIAGARRSLLLSSAYFVPDAGLSRLLRRAAGRGVDIRVLNPGCNTDRPAAWYAGRRHYGELLRAGVRIFEYEPTMIHAKTFVVDGCVGAVGTLNLDNRSFVLNDEVVLVTSSPEASRRLAERFEDDLRHAREVQLEEFERRPRLERWRERLAGLVEPVL